MNKPLKVSIIIPTYNRSVLLSKTLDSIIDQNYENSLLEIVISDDGSIDNTSQIVKRYQRKLNIQYLYQEKSGRRLSLARNNGIIHSTGDVCMFIDSGIILNKTCIKNHLNKFSIHSLDIISIGYVFGFYLHDHNDKTLKKVLNNNKGQTDALITFFKENNICLDMREPFFKSYNYNLISLPAPWVFFWTGNVVVPRHFLIDNGLFDVNYDPNWGMEDIDLGYRLFKNGVKYILSSDAETIHYPHEKDMNENYLQSKLNEKYFHSKFNNEDTNLYLQYGWELNDFILSKGRFLV